MKPAALLTTLSVHALAVGACALFSAEVVRQHAQPLEVALLASVGKPAAASMAQPAHNRQQTAAGKRDTAPRPINPARNDTLPLPPAAPANGSTVKHGATGTGKTGTAPTSSGTAGVHTRTPAALPASYAASNRKPDYPLLARKNDEQGTVVLRVLVTADGRAGQVQIAQSSGYRLLDDSALSAVQAWRFRPATQNNQPVAEWYRLAIPFKLRS